jgi:hypothetical protein
MMQIRYSKRGINMFLKNLKKKYRINIKMIENHLNIIVVMNVRLNHVILESNVRKRKNR